MLGIFKIIHPNEPGSSVNKGHHFLTKLGRAYRVMRELIAEDQLAMQALLDHDSSTSESSSNFESDSDDEGERATEKESTVEANTTGATEEAAVEEAAIEQGTIVVKQNVVKGNKRLKTTDGNKVESDKTTEETSTDLGNVKMPKLKLSFGVGLKSSSYVICKTDTLLTMSTD